jgi:hypothetical protein
LRRARAEETVMKSPGLSLIVALSCAVVAPSGWTQASAPPSAPAASAASALPAPKAGPRLMTPAEKRANAAAAIGSDLRPERPGTPQLSIPFGKKPPPAPKDAGGAGTAEPAASAIVDDAARCESQAPALRAKCLDQRARENKPR